MLASLIAYLQLFRSIPAADQALILAAWEARSVVENETLAATGKVCQELFFIQQGVLRIITPQDNGKEVVYFFQQENQLCTILPSFTKQVPAEVEIQAACPTQVLAIRKTCLDTLCHQLPYLAEIISQLMQEGLVAKIQIRQAYLGQDSAARYQHFLVQQPDVARRVSLADTASYLGITPQSLSRLRKNRR